MTEAVKQRNLINPLMYHLRKARRAFLSWLSCVLFFWGARYRDHRIIHLKSLVRKNFCLIQKRFPEKKCYFLSDKPYRFDFCPSVQTLNNVKEKLSDCAFIVMFEDDETAVSVLEKIKKEGGSWLSVTHSLPTAPYRYKDTCADKALSITDDLTREFDLSHYDEKDFQNIMQAIRMTREVEGDYVEIGTFMGTSAVAALSYMQVSGIRRQAYFLDTFEGFQYQEAQNSKDVYWYGTHVLKRSSADHQTFLRQLFNRFSLDFELVRGNICRDDLPQKIEKIALCNLDVDMYEAVLAGLYKVAPRMSDYGIIIAEDPGHTPWLLGAEMAVRDFLKSEAGRMFLPVYLESGQFFLMKKKI